MRISFRRDEPHPETVIPVWMLGIVLIAAHPRSAFAQAGQAQLAGTIKDSSGGVVPGASIGVINERTAATRMTVTNDQGRFIVPGLSPSVYTVKATASGFAVSESMESTCSPVRQKS
jgi:hypothetical protein